MNIRLLKENEIEVRVGTINEKGATLLLYKDARVDMNILDESGLKWKRSHELINGNLFCTISIWDEDIKEWISRQDVGVESNTEKEKGQASDAFKRAGFNFGIGRELYTAPFTWISADKYSSFINPKTNKPSTYDKFSVTKIGYNENKEISELEIINVKTGAIVSTFNDKPAEKPYWKKEKESVENVIDMINVDDGAPTDDQINEIRVLATRKGTPEKLIQARLKTITTKDQADEALAKLRK